MPRGPPQNLDPRWTSGELREEAREREEARRRAQEQQAQQRAGRPAYSGAPAGAPAAERVTVHDLVSEAPVVAEAPAGDGGLQSLHWSESQLQSDDDGDTAHSFMVCDSGREAPRDHPNPVKGQSSPANQLLDPD